MYSVYEYFTNKICQTHGKKPIWRHQRKLFIIIIYRYIDKSKQTCTRYYRLSFCHITRSIIIIYYFQYLLLYRQIHIYILPKIMDETKFYIYSTITHHIINSLISQNDLKEQYYTIHETQHNLMLFASESN